MTTISAPTLHNVQRRTPDADDAHELDDVAKKENTMKMPRKLSPYVMTLAVALAACAPGPTSTVFDSSSADSNANNEAERRQHLSEIYDGNSFSELCALAEGTLENESWKNLKWTVDQLRKQAGDTSMTCTDLFGAFIGRRIILKGQRVAVPLIAQLKGVRAIEVHDSPANDYDVHLMTLRAEDSTRRLVDLKFHNTQVTGANPAINLSRFDNLRRLYLTKNAALTSIAEITIPTSLEALDVSGSKNLVVDDAPQVANNVIAKDLIVVHANYIKGFDLNAFDQADNDVRPYPSLKMVSAHNSGWAKFDPLSPSQTSYNRDDLIYIDFRNSNAQVQAATFDMPNLVYFQTGTNAQSQIDSQIGVWNSKLVEVTNVDSSEIRMSPSTGLVTTYNTQSDVEAVYSIDGEEIIYNAPAGSIDVAYMGFYR